MTSEEELSAESSPEFRDVIRDLPPSAKLVVLVLEHSGTLSQREIAEESLLPKRTVRLGLEKLQALNIVESRTSLRDARKRLYTLSDSAAEHVPFQAD